MKVRSISVAVVILGLSAACVALMRQVEIERDRVQTEASLRRAEQARVQELEGIRARLEQELETLYGLAGGGPTIRQFAGTAESSPLRPAREAGTGGNAPSGPAESGHSVVGPGVSAAGRVPPVLARFMDDPEWQKVRQAQQKFFFRRMYGDLIRELGLTQEEADAFVEALTEQQMSNLVIARQSGGDAVAMSSSMREARAEMNARLLELLGPAGLQQYEDYQRTLGERMRVNAIADQLEALDVPLRDDQRKQLVTAMVEERERIPPPSLDGLSPKEMADRQLEWHEDYERRIRERAAQVLTPEQLEQFTNLQKLQTQMRRMAFSAVEASGNAVFFAPAPPAGMSEGLVMPLPRRALPAQPAD